MTKDEALKLAIETLESSRVFVMSREVIKRPEGADWYDSRITAIKEALAQPEQEAIYGMNPDDWKDLTEAVKKMRDGRGIYLACRPADVFQEWFLALGTAKIKEKNT